MPNNLKILRLPEVIARTGLSRSSIYAGIAAGNFPPSILIGIRSVGFLEREISEWLESRIAISRGGTK